MRLDLNGKRGGRAVARSDIVYRVEARDVGEEEIVFSAVDKFLAAYSHYLINSKNEVGQTADMVDVRV